MPDTKTLAEYVGKIPMEARMAHKGPWWGLLSDDDKKAVAELTRGLFSGENHEPE